MHDDSRSTRRPAFATARAPVVAALLLAPWMGVGAGRASEAPQGQEVEEAAEAGAAQDTPLNFEDHIFPIMDEYCIGCHRGSRARNGFKAGTAGELVEGGSGGAGVVPGDAAGSLLYQLVARTREPFMPYDDDPLPADLVETIRAWIDSGARETASSRPRGGAVAPRPQRVAPAADNRPAGEPAMPAGLSVDPVRWAARGEALVALAASPWAPVVATGGLEQVVLHGTGDGAVLGVLPFPEGSVEHLTFSRDGAILVAAGGHGGRSGRVVGFDVATGTRVLEIGDEPDVVLAAGLSNDRVQVALGGPDRLVRVYRTETGVLEHEIDKHTDWITTLAFSPDGVLLATADRAGGLFVWEASTGREFHALEAHPARITAVAWRSDGGALATACEDGQLRIYDMESGARIRQTAAHGGGALAVNWSRDGRIVSAGRDGRVRLWDGNLGAAGDFAGPGAETTAAALGHDGAIVVGDLEGRIAVLAPDGTPRTALAAHPPTPWQRAVAVAADEVARHEAQLPARFAARQEAERVAREHADALAAAEAAATAAAQQRDDAALRVEELRASAGAARAEHAQLTDRLAACLSTVEDARAAHASAQVEAERRRAELDAALDELLAAEAAGNPDRLAQARRLHEAAVVLAQKAAAQLGELEVGAAGAGRELELRTAAAAPRLAAAEAVLAEFAAAEQDAASSLAAATNADAEAMRVRSVAGAASRALEALDVELATLQAEITAARSALAEARAEWAERRARIEARDGRVAE